MAIVVSRQPGEHGRANRDHRALTDDRQFGSGYNHLKMKSPVNYHPARTKITIPY